MERAEGSQRMTVDDPKGAALAITAAQLDIIFRSQGASKVKGDLRDVGGAVDKAGGGFGLLRAAALGLGGALFGGLGVGVKVAADLEQGIANVNASLGGVDPTQLEALATSFRQIGSDSRFSATEVAAVGDELARAGFSVEEMLGGATRAVVDLSQATGASLETSVSGIGAAMAIWDPAVVGVETGLTDAAQAADILTVAANKSKAEVGDIIAGMRNLGPVAGQMGIGFDEAAAAIAMMTTYGLKGADAGVSLARGLTNLADPTSEAADLMTGLGIAAFDLEGNFVGFPALFDQLSTSMKGMDDQTKLMALSTIFGAEAADAMALAVAAGEDPLLAIMEAMEGSGQAAEQSALRMDTLGAQVDTLKEGVVNLLGTWTRGLIPGLRRGVDAANRFVNSLDWMSRRFTALRQAGLNPLAAAVTALGEAFPALQRVTRPLGAALQDLGIAFARFRDAGMNPVMAGLRALETVFPATARVIEPMILVARNLRDAFAELMAGDFGGFLDQMGDVAGVVIDVAVSIGSWAISAAVDLATAVWDWVTANIGTIAATIWDVAVSIGSWAISAAQDLWSAVKEWALGGTPAGDGTGGATGPNGGAGALVQIGSVGVRILDWVVSAATSAWDAIVAYVTGSGGERGVFGASPTGGAGAIQPIEFGDPIPIKVGNWDIQIDWLGFAQELDRALAPDISISDAQMASLNAKGQEIGDSIWAAIDTGIRNVFSGGGSGGGDGGPVGGGGGSNDLSDAIVAFVSGIIEGAGAGLATRMAGGAGNMLEPITSAFDTFATNVSEGFQIALDEMVTGLETSWDDINWPSFSAPDIDWPDFPTEIPGWDTLKAAIEDMVAFLKDPWGGTIAIPAPDITWPQLPDIPGDWVAWKDDVSGFFDDLFGGGGNGPAQGAGGVQSLGGAAGGIMGDIAGNAAWSAAQGRDGGSGGKGWLEQQFGGINMGALARPAIGANAAPAGDFAGLAQGVRDVKAAFEEASGSAGTFAGELDTVATSAGTAATAGQALGTGIAQGVLNALPVFSAALQGYTTQLTTQSATWGTTGTTAGQAAGVGLTQGILNALPVFVAALTAYTTQITTASATLGAAGLASGQAGGVGLAQGLLNALPVFAAAMAGYTAVINNEAGPMGAAGLNAGASAGFGVANGLASASGAISGEVGTWAGIVNGAAGALGAAGYNAGAAAGFGVANGLNSALGAVQAAASAIAAAASAAMSATLAIASPSRVTRRIGEYAGEGFALGITDTLADVRAASADLATAGVPTLGRAGSGAVVTSGAAGGGGSVDNSITITFTGPISGGSREELNAWASRDLIPRLERAITRQRRAQGVTA